MCVSLEDEAGLKVIRIAVHNLLRLKTCRFEGDVKLKATLALKFNWMELYCLQI